MFAGGEEIHAPYSAFLSNLTPAIASVGLPSATASSRRGGPTSSGGTPGPNCDGVFTIDWNAFAHGVWVPPSGQVPNNPAPFLLLVGQQINVQWWGRDTVLTGTFMSDALEYRVCP